MTIFRSLVTLLFLSLATLSWAQDRIQVPERFLLILKGFEGFSGQYGTEPFTNSAYNWATRAQHIGLFDEKSEADLAVKAARWFYTRSESTAWTLARVFRTQLRALFGEQYTRWQFAPIVKKAYTTVTDDLYLNWYGCVAKSTRPAAPGWSESGTPIGEDSVLEAVSYSPVAANGTSGSCKEQYEVLSLHYGVRRLTADQLVGIGALSRRHAAHQDDPRYLDAEVLRRIAIFIFEDDQQ